ncbi:MAG TPA: S8 family serine peptidase [Mycobacteriales bacterium]|nr:S8 family serine peptidase [Mycobacteriales bacterium]
MSRFSLSGRRGGRTAARALVVAAAVSTLAPAAATASAAGGSGHSLHAIAAKHNAARTSALKALRAMGGLQALAHQHGASDGFVRSQFPAHGVVNAMVQLSARPAIRAYVAARVHGQTAAVSAARSEQAQISTLAHSVQSHFSAPTTAARTLYTVRNVYAGIAVRTDVSHLAAIARLSGVTAIHPLATYHVNNSSTVPLVGAPQVWAGGADKDTGVGVKIGIIDTGIDYTHATFGGTGNSRAYDADHAVDDSATLNVPSGDYPSKKVVGGVDLAGDAYDPAAGGAAAIPHTDPNPLDCEGHGSHVAGTAAGYGVASDGTTYTGGYSTLNALTSDQYRSMFRIGPGVAPGAELYAIRVFGCEGDTNLVSEALDWASDPNGDGNFNDHLDVVNMSLGSDFGVPDDADAVASNNLALLGTTVVASAGNGGDTQAIAGTPAGASRVISVAASDDAMAVFDAMQENTPVSQKIAGQRNVLYDWANNGPVTGDVQAVNPAWQPGDDFSAGNADGCSAFSDTQKTLVAGKIAWEEWTDDDAVRACGSIKRANNAFAAGAIGVIFSDDQDAFAAGIYGSADIPTFQIRKVDSDSLRADAEAGSLNVTLTYDLRNSVTVMDPSKTDQVASFSSRGWGDPNVVKPDIAAPGVSVFSTAIGTGNEGASMSGTSMAAPHTTGMAALVKAAHPSWYPEQIKAALMDTAAAPVTAPNGDTEAPDRVGSGRAEVDRAVSTDVLAYAFGNSGGVGLSFGQPEITQTTTLTRQFKVENDSGSDQTYDLGYNPANSGTQPAGVTFSLPSTVTVPANSSRLVNLSMTVDPSQLDRPIDATRNATDPAVGLPNYYVPEASGWVTLSQGGNEALRLPMYAAPKATSQMHAASDSVSFGDYNADDTRPGLDFGSLALSGNGFNTSDYQSVVAGFELGATSPQKPACTSADTDISTCTVMPDDAAADIHYVGAASDYQSIASFGDSPDNSLTYFAVSAFGPWRSPAGYHEYDVNIDGNGDGQPDAVLVNTYAGDDDMLSVLFDPTFSHILDVEALNGVTGDADSNAFGNDTMVLPVASSALDAIAPSGNITYWVDANSIYSGLADETAPAHFNFHTPGLTVDDANDSNPSSVPYAENAFNSSFQSNNGYADYPLYWLDEGTNTLDVARNRAQLAADGANKLLLVHLNNGNGQTTDVVDVRDTTASTVTLSRSKAQYSQPVTATVDVTAGDGTGPQATGQVQLLVDGHTVATHTLHNGASTFVLPRLNARSTAYSISANYLGDTVDAPSSSAPALLTVVRQGTRTRVHASDTTPVKGQRVTFTATVRGVSGTTATPRGTVTFFVDGKKWGKAIKLVHGHASRSETGFLKGKHTVKVVYSGNSNQRPSHGSVTVTVS